MTRPPVIALGLTLAISAAAASQTSPDDASRCRDAGPTTDAPPIGAVVDSAGFANALERLRVGRNERATLVRIMVRPDGEIAALEAYGERGGASDGRAVERALRPYLLDLPATGEHQSHWIESGPGPREVTRARFARYCDPVLQNAEELGALVSRAYGDHVRRSDTVAPRGRVLLLIRVGVDGRPGAVRIVESSRDDDWDRTVRTIARRARFSPGRVGDRTVLTSVTLPFAIPGR